MSSKMHFSQGQQGLTGLLKEGYRHYSGVEEAILKNVDACKQLSQITRSSLGPNGMNKLVINHLEKLFVTSDAATICKELELNHPAAKMLVMAAKTQEEEKGDGSNFVVTFAGTLLENAGELLRTGVHPSDVLMGYKQAYEQLTQILPQLVVHNIKDIRDEAELTMALQPVIASKHFGYEDLLAPLVARACISVMPVAPRPASLNVDNVRVAKIIGGSVADSHVLRGAVVQRGVEGTVRHVKNAKVAVFSEGVEAPSTEAKGTVLIESADELKQYNKTEEQRMEETIKSIHDAGVRVVISGGSISEIAQHFLNKYDIMTIKILSKFEMRRLCRAVGATAMSRLGAPSPDEIGHVDTADFEEIGGRWVVVFRQEQEESGLATIVVRGSTGEILEDMERAINDAVAVAKQLGQDGQLLPGAAASDMELAHRISQVAAKTEGLEQYSLHKFAESLEIIARILSDNSGQDASEVISSLYAAHSNGKCNQGVDVEGNGTLDAVEHKIFDSFTTKVNAFRLAVDAAITVLRVDQIIMSKQAGGPKPRGAQ